MDRLKLLQEKYPQFEVVQLDADYFQAERGKPTGGNYEAFAGPFDFVFDRLNTWSLKARVAALEIELRECKRTLEALMIVEDSLLMFERVSKTIRSADAMLKGGAE